MGTVVVMGLFSQSKASTTNVTTTTTTDQRGQADNGSIVASGQGSVSIQNINPNAGELFDSTIQAYGSLDASRMNLVDKALDLAGSVAAQSHESSLLAQDLTRQSAAGATTAVLDATDRAVASASGEAGWRSYLIAAAALATVAGIAIYSVWSNSRAR